MPDRPENDPCAICGEPWRHCICCGHPTRAEREAMQAASSASDLAAARDRLETLADALEEMLITYQNPRTDAMRRVQDAAAIRTVSSSLGDGDDSARLDWLECARPDVECMWIEQDGADWRWVLTDDNGDAMNAGSKALREAIDAARTAPGGESNAN